MRDTHIGRVERLQITWHTQRFKGLMSLFPVKSSQNH
jgi:hypothetical protein